MPIDWVRIDGPDRCGLERLLRYCARPPFALQRLEPVGDDQLVYRFAKPLPDGRTELRLTPWSWSSAWPH